MISYVDEQFEKYLVDESGLNRRNIVDNRVHCCFYFIDSAGHGYVMMGKIVEITCICDVILDISNLQSSLQSLLGFLNTWWLW